MKSDTTKISLESIQFLFRHPWVFVYPFIIIISAFYGAISSSITLKYQCSSILSLDTIGGTVIDSKFIEKKIDLIGRVLLGDNIRNIIKTVWPAMNENADPAGYNGLMGSLRDSKGGILMEYDRKDRRLLTISYTDRDPEVCYKVVLATINTIEKANKQSSAKELETGMDFLRRQVDFYRKRLKAVGEETSKIKSELKEKSLGLSAKERDIVEEILGGLEGKNVIAPGFSAASQKAVKYEEISADLNLQLLEVARKRENIEKQLKTGIFSKQSQGAQSIEDDAFVKEYSHAIATKELETANLFSQGYTSEHPHVVRLHKEIGELESG